MRRTVSVCALSESARPTCAKSGNLQQARSKVSPRQRLSSHFRRRVEGLWQLHSYSSTAVATEAWAVAWNGRTATTEHKHALHALWRARTCCWSRCCQHRQCWREAVRATLGLYFVREPSFVFTFFALCVLNRGWRYRCDSIIETRRVCCVCVCMCCGPTRFYDYHNYVREGDATQHLIHTVCGHTRLVSCPITPRLLSDCFFCVHRPILYPYRINQQSEALLRKADPNPHIGGNSEKCHARTQRTVTAVQANQTPNAFVLCPGFVLGVSRASWCVAYE